MPSRSGRTEAYRSANDRRNRSSVSSGSTPATNWLSQRPSNSAVLQTATGRTSALSSSFE